MSIKVWAISAGTNMASLQEEVLVDKIDIEAVEEQQNLSTSGRFMYHTATSCGSP